MNCSGNREEIWEFIKKNLSDNHLTSLNPKLDSNLASSTIMLNLKFPSHLTSTVHINDERYLYNRIYVIILPI